jgi:peptidoglycan/LPS O-acetylase OafA/YrhL
MTNNSLPQSDHLRGIDSLRALAVVAVILYHLDHSYLPGGFVGVDIFFAISGFVITKSLMERKPKGVIGFFTGFYRRRILRIAPALFVYLAIVLTLSSYFIPKTFLNQSIYQTGTWAIFGASNIQLVMSSDGYFGERMDYSPFLHTWSLGVEEQFYLVYPLILCLLVFATIKARKSLIRIAWALLTALTLASLALSTWQTQSQPLQAFYLLPSRFWELAFGALLYLLVAKRSSQLTRNFRLVLSSLGVVLLLSSLFFADLNNFPFYWALPAVLASVIFIFLATNTQVEQTKLGKLFTSKPIVYLGKISYSLYLWHWGVIVLMRWTLGITLWWQQLLGIALTLLLSSFSYKFIETPIRSGKFIRKRANFTVFATGALVATLLVSNANFANALSMNRAKAISDPAFVDRALVIKTLQGIKTDSSGVGKKIIFVGDSHAGHYKNLGHWVATKSKSEFTKIMNRGCTFVNLQFLPSSAVSSCPSSDEMIRKITAISRAGDIIVLSEFSTPRIASTSEKYDPQQILEKLHSDASAQDRKLALAHATTVVKQLQARGLNVVLAAPTPVFTAPPDRCNRWFNEINPICADGFSQPYEIERQYREPVMESYQALATTTGAILWDPFPLLCADGKTCPAKQGNHFLYIDQHHLSANGNLLLIDSFLALVRTVWS